jgi:ATP-binding cassette, subfamily B, bacterial CvaB/MchF/RaxB
MRSPLRPTIFRRRHTPVVLQTETAECGVACLAMIAGRYGYRTDLSALRRHYQLSNKGMTLHDIVRLAAGIRLATRALRLDIHHLNQLRLPCILHWDHNHFVVLTQVRPGGVTIHDPAMGRRRIPMREVSERFTGVALEAWPTEGFERKTERARIHITQLLRRTDGFVSAATHILLMSLILEAIIIALPIGFQLVLDDVIVSNDSNLLTLVAIGFALLVAFRALTEFVRSWAVMSGAANLTLQWKASLFDHLLRLPLGFFERRHVGDLASRFNSIDTIQQTLGTTATGLVDGAMAITLLIIMWIYNPFLTVLAVAMAAAYAAIRTIAYRLYRAANEEAIINAARENSHFIETLRGMPSIKALVMGERRKAIWTNYLVDRVSADTRVHKLDLAFSTTNTLLSGLDRTLIIFFGAHAIMSGSLSVGMLVAFIAYKDQFSHRVGKLLDTMVHTKMLSLHGERIADVAIAEPEPLSTPRCISRIPAEHGRAGARLTATDIDFRYGDNERPVLSSANIDVAPGECLAIAGPSGAGKTTLLKILAGLLRPNAGVVLFDDVPIQEIGLESYRERIGCVLQDDRLFAGSILENIVGFVPTPDLQLVEQVAKQAAIHDEILRMPMGYETLVGDMGSALSGGQMQRIVLARALYRRPRLLLLDEATSHLDEENERAINTAIRSLTISRVIIAHRRSTLEMADRVVPIWPTARQIISRAGNKVTAGEDGNRDVQLLPFIPLLGGP